AGRALSVCPTCVGLPTARTLPTRRQRGSPRLGRQSANGARLRRKTPSPLVYRKGPEPGPLKPLCHVGRCVPLCMYRNEVLRYTPHATQETQATTTAKARKRVAIYVRVSTTAQTTENQRRELLEVAERAGWDVVGVF